jgi:Fe-S cluster assembly protein SufD
LPSDTVLSPPADGLAARLSALDPAILPLEERRRALERFRTATSGRQPPSRFWRIDLETLAPGERELSDDGSRLRIVNANPRAIVCDLKTAAAEHAPLLRRALETAPSTKFGWLARAFAQFGAFVYVPADADCEQPIELSYTVAAGSAVFPTTVVLLEHGARASLIERFSGGAGAFVCGATQALTGEGADLLYAASQELAPDAQFLQTRSALPGRESHFAWSCADFGAALCVNDLDVTIAEPGIDAVVTAIFFPTGSQHVDLVSTVDHRVGDAQSHTHVKTAAAERGQGRYLGTIRIAPGAQGSDASLRDDALLLSAHAHVDSVPALEIGANDVKAYHGATVGAIDDDQIFYAQSRGIDRTAAERMIALGFFEPAIERFPTEHLRRELRAALEAKVS